MTTYEPEGATQRYACARGARGIDAITLHEGEVPRPGAGEVLVRLLAATLNFRDLLFAKGALPGLTKEPAYVPLSCAVGVVVALGEGVETLRKGDRVSPTFYQNAGEPGGGMPEMLGGSADGVARDWGVFPQGGLVRVPDELGDLEAATLPCAGLTAWNSLFAHRPLQTGETVLCQGTGGVSLAALQWAKASGARVVITSSSDAKLARARALGADIGINYRTHPDWAAEVRRVLGVESGGVDIVIDVVGGTQLGASASVLKEGGLIAAIGRLEGEFSWDKDIGKRIERITVGSPAEHEAMLSFAAARGIRPVVDVVYELERLKDAMRHQESGDFFGKIGINLH